MDDSMNDWLESQGFYRKRIAKDSTCLFRIVAEEVFLTQTSHNLVAEQCLNFMEKHPHQFLSIVQGSMKDHVENVRKNVTSPGVPEIHAAALLYKYDIILYEKQAPPCKITDYGFPKKIRLCSSGNNLYDVVYLSSTIETAAFCQSVVYRLLYEKVFQQREIEFAVETMLYDQNYRPYRDPLSRRNKGYGNPYGEGYLTYMDPTIVNKLVKQREQGLADVRELLSHGLTPFPYKVAKALDPKTYRNIAYDVWNEIHKGVSSCPSVRRGWPVSDSVFQIGARCLVKIEEKLFHAYIQDMEADKGPVLVYVEEKAEKMAVQYKDLEPLTKGSSNASVQPLKNSNSISNKNETVRQSNKGQKDKKILPINVQKVEKHQVPSYFNFDCRQPSKKTENNIKNQESLPENTDMFTQDHSPVAMNYTYSAPPNIHWDNTQYTVPIPASEHMNSCIQSAFKCQQNILKSLSSSPPYGMPTAVPFSPPPQVTPMNLMRDTLFNGSSMYSPETHGSLYMTTKPWTDTNNQHHYYCNSPPHENFYLHPVPKRYSQRFRNSFSPAGLSVKTPMEEQAVEDLALPDSTTDLGENENNCVQEEQTRDRLVMSVNQQASLNSYGDGHNNVSSSTDTILPVKNNVDAESQTSTAVTYELFNHNMHMFPSSNSPPSYMPCFYPTEPHSPVMPLQCPFFNPYVIGHPVPFPPPYAVGAAATSNSQVTPDVSGAVVPGQESPFVFPETICFPSQSPVPLSPVPLSPVPLSPVPLSPVPFSPVPLSQQIFCQSNKLYPINQQTYSVVPRWFIPNSGMSQINNGNGLYNASPTQI